MLLIIDNYDSFTYNLYQAFAELESDVRVVKNDQITLAEIEELHPKGIVLSPGREGLKMRGSQWLSLRNSREKFRFLGSV